MTATTDRYRDELVCVWLYLFVAVWWMLRLALISLGVLAVMVLATNTLDYSRLISDGTKFKYCDGPNSCQNVTFIGFTVRGNIVCRRDQPISGSSTYVAFEKPNLRVHGPREPRTYAWYNLTLYDDYLGVRYMNDSKQTYDMNILTNKQIYGAKAKVIVCKENATLCNPPNSTLTLPDVTESLILRGGMKQNFNAGEQAVMVSDLLARLSNDSSGYFPLGVVGGCIRDFLAGDIGGINDIDAALAQDYNQIAYRLKDIFVDWNQPIDSSVLDQKGIRKEFGLLKIRPQEYPAPDHSCSERKATELCYADGLDIGPFKAQFNMSVLNGTYISGYPLTEDEKSNHYVYAYSYSLDGYTRDFTINTIYYDYLGDVMIDPTGQGMNDSRHNILRIADPLTSCDSTGCPWSKDLGGWFRYWRFIGKPYVTRDGTNHTLDGKSYSLPDDGVNITVDHVCHNLNKAMCAILNSPTGRNTELNYNAYSFFLKLRKKRKFTPGNVAALLDSWGADLFAKDNESGQPDCGNTWHLLTQLAASNETKMWTHLLEESPETDLVLKIINHLDSKFKSQYNSTAFDCTRMTSLSKSAVAPLIPMVPKSLKALSSDATKNFECFMRHSILSGRPYRHSELIEYPADARDETLLEQTNLFTLDEYEYYYGSHFEESSIPVVAGPYPRWTDLKIVVASELSRPLHVHKLVLLFVYSRVSLLSPSSQLSRFVQAMQDGDVHSLSKTELTVSDISYTALMNELDYIYEEEHWDNLLRSMSDWRYRVASQEEIAMAQWNSLGGSPVVTSDSETFLPLSRFFLASFCHVEGVEALKLASRTRDLFWEVDRQRLPSPEDVGRFLDLISWDISAAPNEDTQRLVDMAKAGDFYCSLDEGDIETSSSYSSSTSDGTSHNPSTWRLFTIFVLLMILW